MIWINELVTNPSQCGKKSGTISSTAGKWLSQCRCHVVSVSTVISIRAMIEITKANPVEKETCKVQHN